MAVVVARRRRTWFACDLGSRYGAATGFYAAIMTAMGTTKACLLVILIAASAAFAETGRQLGPSGIATAGPSVNEPVASIRKGGGMVFDPKSQVADSEPPTLTEIWPDGHVRRRHVQALFPRVQEGRLSPDKVMALLSACDASGVTARDSIECLDSGSLVLTFRGTRVLDDCVLSSLRHGKLRELEAIFESALQAVQWGPQPTKGPNNDLSRRILSAHMGEFKKCEPSVSVAREDPERAQRVMRISSSGAASESGGVGPQRRVSIRATVQPNGSLRDIRISEHDLDESTVGLCLKRAVERISFPVFTGESVPFALDLQVASRTAQ
jgi:hypothetical protein